MRYLLLFFILASNLTFGQHLTVKKTEKITDSNEATFAWATFSFSGKNIIVSTEGYKGLYTVDISTKKIKKITDADGAGYKPLVGKDQILFLQNHHINSRKHKSLHLYDVRSNTSKEITTPTRRLKMPQPQNGKVELLSSGKKRSIHVTDDISDITVVTQNLKPILRKGVSSKEFLPNGEGNYIWVSLSPDATKVVYNYNGRGTYVADLEGNIIAELGRLQAPKWLGNHYIVGMNDKDDGHRILSSDIIAFSLKTKQKQNLTQSKDCIELYPVVSKDGTKIAYHTAKGEIHMLHIEQ